MLFEGRWTFLHAILEKVDFFACFWGESGPFCLDFRVKVDFFGGKWTILVKIVDYFGHFWTMGGAFAPLAPPPLPLATGLYGHYKNVIVSSFLIMTSFSLFFVFPVNFVLFQFLLADTKLNNKEEVFGLYP